MPTKSGAYVYLDDGTSAQQVYVGNQIDTNIQPVEIQSRYASTIQTHNAVSVGASSWSYSSWYDCDGFDKVGVKMKNDASTPTALNIQWSDDNSTTMYDEALVGSGTPNTKGAISDIKGRYARIGILNNDTVAHTVSSSMYLKS
jgi:hypothetical protein